MSAPKPPICPLGLTPDDLSAWRDHVLSSAAEARITDHLSDVSGCPACQRTLTAHDALAAALRAEQVPMPDPRNWSRLQARIAASPEAAPPLAVGTLRRAQRSAFWGGLSAAAAVALLSALFFHLFADQARVLGSLRHVATPTVAPTPTAIPTPRGFTVAAPTTPIAGEPPEWQTYADSATVLALYGSEPVDNSFAFAPSDPRTAYLCVATSGPSDPLSIWATHDGAASWTYVSALPDTPALMACGITVDAANPMRLNLVTSKQGAVFSYLSDDGGKTWRSLSTDMQLLDLSTRGAVSVAIPLARTLPGSYANSPGEPVHLVVSDDDWRTWRPIDSQLVAQGVTVTGVWQRPGDGALLAQGFATNPATTSGPVPQLAQVSKLWESSDLGAHWTLFPTPASPAGLQPVVVARPEGSAAWHICDLADVGGSMTTRATPVIGCTSDGGRTWTARPLPKLSCDMVAEPNPVALLSDGTIVAGFSALPKSGPHGPCFGGPKTHIFVLAPGASVWRDVGEIHGTALVMFSSGSQATLITYLGSSQLTAGERFWQPAVNYEGPRPSAPQPPNTLLYATIP